MPLGVVSAECPTCGQQEHHLVDIVEDDEGCLVMAVLECQSCLNLSTLDHGR